MPVEWLKNLAERIGFHMETGIWIAAEHREEYELALLGNEEAAMHIVRRMSITAAGRIGKR